MKKLLLILLAITMCVSMCACGTNAICAHENIVSKDGVPATCTEDGLSDGEVCASCGEVLVEQTKISATGHNKTVVPEKAATCTSNGTTKSEKCSDCGYVFTKAETIPALGHTEGWNCERCSYSTATWEKKYFVDEFDDPTSESYIGLKSEATGTFSNSATTNSNLSVYMLYGRTNSYPNVSFGPDGLGTDYFNIFLYEYGNHQVKNSSNYSEVFYLMKIKTESGKVYELVCSMPPEQDRIWVYDHDSAYNYPMSGTNATNLKFLFMQGGKMKIILINIDRTVEQYSFEIDTSNFFDELSKLN